MGNEKHDHTSGFQSGIALLIEEGVLPIKALTYEVCSSDGKEILYKEKRKEIGEEPSLTFPGLELADREAILKLTLHTENRIFIITRESAQKKKQTAMRVLHLQNDFTI